MRLLILCFSGTVHIPFFGMTGAYDSAPGIYTSTGAGAAEASNAIGVFYWVWFGITTCREFIKIILSMESF